MESDCLRVEFQEQIEKRIFQFFTAILPRHYTIKGEFIEQAMIMSFTRINSKLWMIYNTIERMLHRIQSLRLKDALVLVAIKTSKSFLDQRPTDYVGQTYSVNP